MPAFWEIKSFITKVWIIYLILSFLRGKLGTLRGVFLCKDSSD